MYDGEVWGCCVGGEAGVHVTDVPLGLPYYIGHSLSQLVEGNTINMLYVCHVVVYAKLGHMLCTTY